MPRLASLYLPNLAIERIWQARSGGRPEAASAAPRAADVAQAASDTAGPLTPAQEAAARADCSCPRGGEWRPGARWAENSKERLKLVQLKERMAVEAQIATLPAHQQPSMRELGRRTEAMQPVFRTYSEPRADRRAEPGRALAGAALGDVLITSERIGQKQVVAAASAAARALGLSRGMAVTQARALVPGLEVQEADPAGDAALLERIGLFAARRWTPRAAVSGPDGLWLDLTGVSHLFGGEEALCRRILRFLARMGLTARIAVAGSWGAAHALARFGSGAVTLCPEGQEAQALAAMPLAALRLEEAALGTARRLGIERVGELLPMPRGPLQRRFGSALLTRLDQALGRVGEAIVPIVPEEPPEVLLRLAEPIATAEAIAEVLGEAMRRLVSLLEKDGLAVRKLLLLCTRVDDQDEAVAVGTARGTRDGVHLLRLLTPKIETIDPGFGIERVRLIAVRVEPLRPEPIAGELAGDKPTPDLVPLIDRLASRLGARHLYRTGAVESDVPERSVCRVGPLGAVAPWPSWPRPARLLSPPEPIDNVVALMPDQPPRRFTWRGRSYRIARADGPERIHGEWWKRTGEADAVRDYFQVEAEDGARFWLFRRGDGEDARTGDLSWYCQGVMG